MIAVGGMLGAAGRYGLEVAWPPPTDTLAWTTLATNVLGCLLIGVLMVRVAEVGGSHPLLRPFLGVGVLGGFTTFSTYTVHAATLLGDGRPVLAVVSLLATAVAALSAVLVGLRVGRALLGRGAA